MAEARIFQEEFTCPVCLDLLKDPVTIPCGHSYCKSCITGCWDQEEEKRVYSCPQCRETFRPRPALAKNTILAEMVEKLKKTRPAADCYAGAGDVQCDVCTKRKYKAIKSCLVCLESYCRTHFERHEEFHSCKPHKMIDATERLQDMICRKTIYNHKNHTTVSSAAQRTEKQKELKEMQMKLQQRVLQRQKDLLRLREAVESHKRSAQTAVEDTEKIFTELIRSIERRCSELTQMIRDQHKTAVSEAEGLMERLEQEIDRLRRRDAELEQLSHTQDHIHFLQSFQSLSVPPETTDASFSSILTFDGLRESVHRLKVKVEYYCKEQIKKITDRVKLTSTITKNRNDFLQYSQQFTLDLNTVNKYLYLSENNRVVTRTGKFRLYPDHPDRFEELWQVLCRESVCGCCYWEIEWSGCVFISVSYKSISRDNGDYECGFGHNDQSWSLICCPSRYSFRHNNIKIDLPVKTISSKVGVYVDHSAGILSFYSVSDTMRLIHTVQTTFTEPICPGFYVHIGSSVELCS
ncbi:tripartite motif-containing protein 16-like [Danio aesculapii]|uniref:tripartite motif-containing protein 16-like n=1 Tax=Danio aesculapii TaxID=1142201 RepID=UPI0024BFDA8B|nr:tripartite motif-containing protein 16-like [Danio aesculapii]